LVKPVGRRTAFVRSPVVGDRSMTLNCPRWRLSSQVDQVNLGRLLLLNHYAERNRGLGEWFGMLAQVEHAPRLFK
jgi:hypothetical protein